MDFINRYYVLRKLSLILLLSLSSQFSLADDLGVLFSECTSTGSSPVGYDCPLSPVQISNGTIKGTDNSWSVFIGGDMTVNDGAESEGRVFVYGDFLLTSGSSGGTTYNLGLAGVGSRVVPENGQDFLTVGGNVTVENASNLIIGGAASDVSFNSSISLGNLVMGGALLQQGTGVVSDANNISQGASIDLASANSEFTRLQGVSTDLATLSASTNGSATFNSWEIRLASTDNASGLYVFNINRDLDNNFGASTSLYLDNFPAAATIIINMTGSGTVNLNLNNAFDSAGNAATTFSPEMRSKILWNFPNASQVNVLGGAHIEGSILAPFRTTSLNMAAPAHNGRVIVGGDVVQDSSGNEFHNYAFNGDFSFPATEADLSLSKVVNNASPNIGDQVIYTLQVQNAGPLTATGVLVEDVLPAGLSFVSYVGTGSYISGTGQWSPGTLANGATASLQMTAEVTASGSISNIAQLLASDQPDPDSTVNNSITTEDDQDNAVITVPRQADLSLAITVSDATPAINDTIIYTLSVTNNGPDSANNIQVSGTLASGVTYISDDGSGSYVTATGLWSVGTLANGATSNLQITASVDQGGVISHGAQISASDESDPDSAPANSLSSEDDQSNVDITVPFEADLNISISDGTAIYTPGLATSYTLVVNNAGPSDASNVLITDTAPTGTTLVSWSCASTNGGTCPKTNGTGDLIETDTLLVNGGTLTYTVNINPPSDFSGNLVNNVTVTSDTTDSNLADNSASDTDTQSSNLDLSISVTDGVTSYTPGASHTSYSVVVNNAGPSDAGNTTVATSFSAGVSITGWSCLATNGSFTCPNSSGVGDINESFSLFPAGGSATYTLNIAVPSTQTGNLLATSTVAAAGDGNAVNDTSIDTNTASITVDYTLNLSDGVANYTAGGNNNYTLVVSNLGPSSGSDSNLFFNAPSGSSITSWSCANGTNVSCPNAAGAGNISENIAAFEAGDSLTYTIVLAVNGGRSGDLNAQANISSTDNDISLLNNTAVDVDTESPSADLTLTLNDGTGSYVPGQGTSYTLTASNVGSLAASNASIQFNAPSNSSITSWTCSSGTVACSAASGVGNINEVLGNFPIAGSLTYTVNLSTQSSRTANLVSNASISTLDSEADTSNNNATDTDTPDVQVDYQLTFDYSTATYTIGGNIAATVLITNLGPSDAQHGSLSIDSATIGTSLLNWTCTGTGTTCPASSGVSSLSQTFSSFPVGATITYSALLSIDSSITTGITATLNLATTDNDINLANNTATDTAAAPDIADVSISKTDGSASYTPGNTISYTLVVNNAGPDTASNILVSDVAPADTSITSWSCSGGSCPSASGSGNLTQTVASLGSGSSLTYVVNLATASKLLTGLSNTATATSDTYDSNVANNGATDTDTRTNSADLAVSISDGVSDYQPGGSHSNYSLIVTNAGPSDAYGVNVTAAMSAGVSIISWSCLASNGTFACPAPSGMGDINETFLNFPVGASATYTFTVDIPSNQTGNLVATANLAAANDPNGANDSASDIDSQSSEVDYHIELDDGISSYTPGASFNYNLMVTNNGPSDGDNGTITFNAPSDSSISAWICTGSGGVSCPSNSGVGNINESFGTFPITGQLTYVVSLTTLSSRTANLTSSASISSTNNDTNNSNDLDTDVDTDFPSIDLAISLSDAQTEYVPGRSVVYTLITNNAGLSNAGNATVRFNAPADSSISSWTCTDGIAVVCANVTGVGNINETLGSFPAGDGLSYQITLDTSSNRIGALMTSASISTTDSEANATNNSDNDTDLIDVQVDYSISLDDGVSNFTPGGSLTYTVVASNLGPSDGTNATISVTSTNGVTVSGWTCVASGGVTCPSVSGSGTPNQNFSTFPVGASVTYTAIADVNANINSQLDTSIIIASTDNDIDLTNNAGTDSDSVSEQADISITKTDGSNSYTPGTTASYTLTVDNAGPSHASNVVITDTAPTATNISSWSCAAQFGASCANASGNGNLSESNTSVIVGGQLIYTVNLDVPSYFTGDLINNASVNSASNDPLPANNSATDTNAQASNFDLSISVNDGQSSYVPGGTHGSYTVTINNSGPSDAGSSSIVTTLSAGVSITSWNCLAQNGFFVCPNTSGSGDISETFTNIPAGASAIYTLNVSIPNNQSGDLLATSAVTSVGDSNNTNDSAIDTNTASQEVDYAVLLSDGKADYIGGTTSIYNLVVSNNGPSTGTNSRVIFNAPTNTSVSSWTCADGSSVVCPNASGTGNISESIGVFATGDNLTYTLNLGINGGRSGDLSATAVINSTDNDTITANNSNSDINTDSLSADLAVTITDGISSYVPGLSTTYTVSVNNEGSAAATNANFKLNAPANSSITVWSCSNGSVVACGNASGTGNIDETLGNFPVGDSLSYSVTLTTPSSRSDNLTVNAVVSTTDSEADFSNNNAADDDVRLAQVDYQTSLAFDAATYTSGTNTGATVVITNAGPSDGEQSNLALTGASLGIIATSWTCSAIGIACPNASGARAPNQVFGVFPVGAVVTYQAAIAIDASVSGVIAASLNMASTDNDINLTNNAATATASPLNETDLSISKTDASSEYTPGSTLTYTLIVTNAGAVDATNVLISDIAPSGSSIEDWSCSGASCPNTSGTGNVTETVATLTSGSTVTYLVSLDVPPGYSTDLANTATVSSDGGDSDNSNNSATDTNTLSSNTDLSISISDGKSSYVSGTVLNYVLTSSNNSSVNASNVLISNSAPVGTQILSWDCVGANGASCNSSSGSGDISEIIANLPGGGSLKYLISVNVPASMTGNLANTASIASATAEINLTDNNDTDVDMASTQAELSISKSNGQASYQNADFISYTLTIDNNGPSDASSVQIIDTAPTGSSIDSWSCIASNGGTCSNNNGIGNLSESIGTLVNGATIIYTLNLDVPAEFTGELINTASVTSTTPDPQPNNNSATDTDSVSLCTLQGRVYKDIDINAVFDVTDIEYANNQVQLIRSGTDRLWNTLDDVVLAVATTDSNGEYSFSGAYCGEFQIKTLKPSPELEDASALVNNITGVTNQQDFSYNESLGVIYDALTKSLVEGAEVRVYRDINGDTQLDDGDLLVYLHTSTVDGSYSWLSGQQGEYIIVVNAPSTQQYSWPSVLIPASDSQAPRIASRASPMSSKALDDLDGLNSGTYFLNFTLNSSSDEIINNDIPLDPPLEGLTRLLKKSEKPTAHVGDIVAYQISLTNLVPIDLSSLSIQDSLPLGFSYIPNTAQLIQAGSDGTLATEDDIVTTLTTSGQGPLELQGIDLLADENVLINYLLRAGAGIPQGTYTNTAQTLIANNVISNLAKANIQIIADPLFDGTSILGKVFHDRDGDGYQDSSDVNNLTIDFSSLDKYIYSPLIERQPKGSNITESFKHHKLSMNIGHINARRSAAEPLVNVSINFSFKIKKKDYKKIRSSEIKISSSEGWRMSTMLQNNAQDFQHIGAVKEGLSGQHITASFEIEAAGKYYNVKGVITNEGIEEPGIAGVRLATVNGFIIETDEFGRYHIAGVDVNHWEHGQNYIIKVDGNSLPKGSKFTTENPLIQRVTSSSLAMFDFGVKLPQTEKITENKQHNEVLGSLFFKTDQAKLTPLQVEQLNSISNEISDLEKIYQGEVFVSGTADVRDSLEYNHELGIRRANNVIGEIKSNQHINTRSSKDRYRYYRKIIRHKNIKRRFSFDLCILDGVVLGRIPEVKYRSQFSEAGRCVNLARRYIKENKRPIPLVEWFADGKQLGVSLLENKPFPSPSGGSNIGIAGVDHRLFKKRGSYQEIHLISIGCEANNVKFSAEDQSSWFNVGCGSDDLPFFASSSGELKALDSKGIYLSDKENDLSIDRRVDISYKGTKRIQNKHKFNVTQDPFKVNPRLAVSAPNIIYLSDNYPLSESSITFRSYSNYTYFIKGWELAIYKGDDTDLISPIKIITGNKLNRHQNININKSELYLSPIDNGLIYVMRVHDGYGKVDETRPQSIHFNWHDKPLKDQYSNEASLDNKNDLKIQSIPVAGNRVRISARDLTKDAKLKIDQQAVYVDQKGRFSIEMILPSGKHVLPYVLQENKQVSEQAISIQVKDEYLFIVAMADLTASQAFVSGNVKKTELDDRFDNSIVLDGRAAFYLKGKVLGKYLLTAQLDTHEYDIADIFKDLHKKDARSAFRRLDPDSYYPVYGDESSGFSDVNSMGRMYVRLEWDKSSVLWGNYNTGFTGSSLVVYNRSLYGAAIDYKDTTLTKYLHPKMQLKIFAAEPGSLSAHNEFLATGGSLYYLRNKDVVVGSEKIWLEVRDTETAQIIERLPLQIGVDYEFDAFQGRILLNQALLNMVQQRLPTIIRSQPLQAEQVYLLADYEYVAATSLSNLSSGVQAKYWFNDQLAFGASNVHEQRSTNSFDLSSVDVTYQHGKGSFLKAEVAQSKASLLMSSQTSQDGGLSFLDIQNFTNSRDSGQASSIKYRGDLAEIGSGEYDGFIDVWWKNKSKGFSEVGIQTLNERIEQGIEGLWKVKNDLVISARFNTLETKNEIEKNTSVINAKKTLSETLILTAEYKHEETNVYENTGISKQQADLIGTKLQWKIYDGLSAYAIAQTAVTNNAQYENNDRLTLGASYQAKKNVRLNAEVSEGDRGKGAILGLNYQVAANNELYSHYNLTTDNNYQRTSVTTVGNRRRFSHDLSAYTEGQFLHSEQENGVSNVFGVDYQLSKQWMLSPTLQASEIEKINAAGNETIDRIAGSLAGHYKNDVNKGLSRIEYRNDDGVNDVEHWLFVNNWRHLYNDELSFSVKLNYSTTDTQGSTLNDAEFLETNLGFAYRQVQNNNWNWLGKYTYLYDLDGYNQIQSSPDQRSHVLALEGLYRINQPWLVGAKAAYRLGERRLTRGTGPWFSSDVGLIGVKGHYRLHKDWSATLEYRWLVTPEAEAETHGMLLALNRYLNDNMQLGLGYNFSDFSDDLTHLNYDVSGWFMNLNFSY
jgi:uncharacterized repeat protein (TIGR01451 family)